MAAHDDDQPSAQTPADRPPLRIRVIARTLSAVIARAPFLWPVLRTPTRRFWERAAAGWDDRIQAHSAERLAPLAAACDRLETEPRRILELGTGTGAGALLLVERFAGSEVWAVDIAEPMIREAERKAPRDLTERLHYTVADAAELPFDDGSFDLVCQLNLPFYAREIVRVLAAGGHVIVASSLGPRTPYYTPERILRRHVERRGLETRPGGHAGEGTYFLARRPPPP